MQNTGPVLGVAQSFAIGALRAITRAKTSSTTTTAVVASFADIQVRDRLRILKLFENVQDVAEELATNNY